MQQIFVLLYYIFAFVYYIHADLLYSCDFDNATLDDNCFTSTVLVLSSMLFTSEHPPDSPASDVTSSLKPTNNGEICKLPYTVGTYTWDMYFCYNNYCPTTSNTISKCASGQFAAIQLLDTQIRSLQLKTESDWIDGINQQTIIYYYYMTNIGEKSIKVRKEEIDGTSEVIDIVTSSPFNGWIPREVKFHATKRGYKLYFDLEKTSLEKPFIDIGLDEISIYQADEFTTENPIITTMSSLDDTSTSETMEPTMSIAISTTSPTTSIQQSSATTTTTTTVQSQTTSDSVYLVTSSTTVHLTTQKTDSTSVLDTSSTTVHLTTQKTDSTSVLDTSSTTAHRTTQKTDSTSVLDTSSTTVRLTTQQTDSTSILDTSSTTVHRTTQKTDSTSILDTSSTTAHRTTQQTDSSSILGTSTIPSATTTVTKTTPLNQTNEKSSNKTIIIVLSTVIPIVLIITIGIIIKIRWSSSSRFSRKKRSKSEMNYFELTKADDDNCF